MVISGFGILNIVYRICNRLKWAVVRGSGRKKTLFHHSLLQHKHHIVSFQIVYSKCHSSGRWSAKYHFLTFVTSTQNKIVTSSNFQINKFSNFQISQRFHINNKSVFHIGFCHAFISFIDFLNIDHFNI